MRAAPPFAAIEMSIAQGRPTVVFATTGPGLTNMLTGMAAARWEGAKVIFVSGTTSAARRGRWAFQETSAHTMPFGDLFSEGSLFHYASLVEDPVELEVAASRLATGLGRPGGFVAHLGLPLSTQMASLETPPRLRLSSLRPPAYDPANIADCVQRLSTAPFAIWAGFGARHCSAELLELAERTGARVMCSPRGKGVFPENHPLYLGVTGLGGHGRVERFMRRQRPEHVLVLGSRLGEFTSFYSEDLVGYRGLIHVDVDSSVFAVAYPQVETLGVEAEVQSFVSALLEAWPASAPKAPLPPRLELEDTPLIPAQGRAQDLRRIAGVPVNEITTPRTRAQFAQAYLMSKVQHVIVEGHPDTIVLTEAGNAFALGSRHLRFATPGRYRVSTGFGSMGHAAAGVIGAAMARRGKAVAIVGDGAMLMLNEMNTAAAYGVQAVWIVLNDARYGMIAQGMESLGWTPFETDFPARRLRRGRLRAPWAEMAYGWNARTMWKKRWRRQ